MRMLVRRDLALVAGGTAVAAGVWAVFVTSRLGWVSHLTAGRIMVGAGALLAAACVGWWAAGPRALLGERYLVLTPVFLVAAPALVGVHDLGGAPATAGVSGAVGFAAALGLGLVWSSRRRAPRG
jgi:hypothetical protein